jgi:GntR family transcriptional regulator, transcriptional repressor for pyruvate dehydrogenase complex
MSLQRVARRSLPDEVYDQLVSQMVDGEVKAGGSLPSERRLADVLGVSRPAVREALQRLAHAGLVDVRQGDTTRVRDFRRSAGLDLLPRLLFVAGDVELSVVRSIMEARQLIGPEAAALAAERNGATVAPYLGDCVSALAEADDPVSRQRHALSFWEHVVDGADSITFRLMFNSLRAAYEPALDALAGLLASEVEQVDAYRSLARAIELGNPRLARRRADELLRRGHDQINSALDQLKET